MSASSQDFKVTQQFQKALTQEIEETFAYWQDKETVEAEMVEEFAHRVVHLAAQQAAEFLAAQQQRVVQAANKLERSDPAYNVMRGISMMLTKVETDILWLKP